MRAARAYVLLSSEDEAGGAVGLELGVGLLQEHQQLLHHAADVVDVDEGKAELHRPPEQHTG